MDKLRTITVPAGIGDFVWLAMKLTNQQERFKVRLPNGTPQRGHQILELLPGIVDSYEYVAGLNYKKIAADNAATNGKRWKELTKQSFTLSANTHLEQGQRIETFLPDLPTAFLLDYATKDSDTATAEGLLKEPLFYVGVYCSAYSNSRHWGGWDHETWFELLRLIYTRRKDACFVLLGAPYDLDLSEKIMQKLNDYNIPSVDTVGQSLSTVVEIMKRLSYAFYFPSGLAILSETLGLGGSVMFYPLHLKPMINSWADPARIKSGVFKECLWCSPRQIFDWCKQFKQI